MTNNSQKTETKAAQKSTTANNRNESFMTADTGNDSISTDGGGSGNPYQMVTFGGQMYTFQERTRAKEFYVRYARRRAPHHASWDIRVASNLWHGIRNERQAKAAWQKRSAVKHYLSHGRYNPSPTVSLATQDALRSLSAGSTSSRLWSARRQR